MQRARPYRACRPSQCAVARALLVAVLEDHPPIGERTLKLGRVADAQQTHGRLAHDDVESFAQQDLVTDHQVVWPYVLAQTDDANAAANADGGSLSLPGVDAA